MKKTRPNLDPVRYLPGYLKPRLRRVWIPTAWVQIQGRTCLTHPQTPVPERLV